MRVKRNLKYATWSYDFDKHHLKLELFSIAEKTNRKIKTAEIKLNRTYMFSIARFIISVAQRIRIEEAKKFREKINKRRGQYLERIGGLKIRLMKSRHPKKEEPSLFEPKKSGQFV